MKMEESPKWLVSQGRFDDALASLQEVARINKSELTITAEDFQQMPDGTAKKTTDKALTHVVHLHGLFATKKLRISTVGLILLWMCIGIA